MLQTSNSTIFEGQWQCGSTGHGGELAIQLPTNKRMGVLKIILPYSYIGTELLSSFCFFSCFPEKSPELKFYILVLHTFLGRWDVKLNQYVCFCHVICTSFMRLLKEQRAAKSLQKPCIPKSILVFTTTLVNIHHSLNGPANSAATPIK